VSRSFVLKGAILVAAAAGFIFAFGSSASATVVDPGSAYQPASVGLAKMAVDASKPSTNPFAALSTAPQIKKADPPPATPAPEPVVARVQPTLASSVPSQSSGSPITRVVRPLRRGVQRFGSYLERVVSSCPVGPVSSTGGPVFVLAVLSVGLALNRRWVLAAQPATDERVPVLLYAWELTPPG